MEQILNKGSNKLNVPAAREFMHSSTYSTTTDYVVDFKDIMRKSSPNVQTKQAGYVDEED